MVFEKAQEFLDEYIKHRERFEERIQERFPAAYSVRRVGTGAVKAIRGLLGPTSDGGHRAPKGKNGKQ